MKMKYYYCCLCLFLTSSVLFAQKAGTSSIPSNISITMGKEQKGDKNMRYEGAFLSDDTGIYGYVNPFVDRNGSPALCHYDKDMNLVKQEEINFMYGEYPLELLDIGIINDKPYALLTYYNSKEEKLFLFMQNIDKNTLKGTGEFKKLAEVPSAKPTMVNKAMGKYRDPYLVVQSGDDSKLMVLTIDYSSKKEDSKKYNITVFDAEFNQLWEKSGLFPYEEDDYNLSGLSVDKQGNAFLTLNVTDKDKKYPNRNDFDYVVLYYYDNGKTTGEYRPELKGKIITSIFMSNIGDGELGFLGTYADDVECSAVSSRALSGVFNMRANPVKRTISTQSVKEINSELIDDYGTHKKGMIVKGRNFSIILMANKSLSDGGHIASFELSHSHFDSQQGSGKGAYEHIITLKIEANGNIGWISVVPKSQEYLIGNVNYLGSGYGSSVPACSFISIVSNDKYYIVYTDNEKNLNVKNGEVKALKGEGITTMVELDIKDGTWEKYKLYDNPNKELITRPMISTVDDNSIILYNEWKTEYNFTRVTFK